MAYIANIVTVAEMQFYAGENVDTTGDVEANHIILQDHAEAYLSNLLKFELSVANWATLNATTKIIITEWAARYAATQLILFNMAGFTSRMEAEDMVSIHLLRMEQIEKLLQMDGVQAFMGVN